MRRLAGEIGLSPSGLHDVVRRMVAAGALSEVPGRRGTALELIGRTRDEPLRREPNRLRIRGHAEVVLMPASGGHPNDPLTDVCCQSDVRGRDRG